MSVKQTLTKARDILIERGVTRGGWFVDNEGCSVCSMGAIWLAAGGEVVIKEYTEYEYDPELDEDVEVPAKDVYIEGQSADLVDEATIALREVISEIPRTNSFYSIPLWNDGTKTDAEVIEAFNRAIALADN